MGEALSAAPVRGASHQPTVKVLTPQPGMLPGAPLAGGPELSGMLRLATIRTIMKPLPATAARTTGASAVRRGRQK